MLYFLFVLAIVLFVLISRRPGNAPPLISYGVPVLGPAIEFGTNPARLLRYAADKFGPIVEINLLLFRMVFLLSTKDGNQGIQWFFKNDDHLMDFETAVNNMVSQSVPLVAHIF